MKQKQINLQKAIHDDSQNSKCISILQSFKHLRVIMKKKYFSTVHHMKFFFFSSTEQ